jgi:hypothetical protein
LKKSQIRTVNTLKSQKETTYYRHSNEGDRTEELSPLPILQSQHLNIITGIKISNIQPKHQQTPQEIQKLS